MRLSLKFVIPLFAVLALFARLMLPYVDSLTVQWFVRDLDIRASLVASTVQEPLAELVQLNDTARIRQLLTRITQDERVYAVGFCPASPLSPQSAGTLPPEVRCDDIARFEGEEGHTLASPQGPLLVSVRALEPPAGPGGRLVLVHDMSFVTRRSEETRTYVFYLFL